MWRRTRSPASASSAPAEIESSSSPALPQKSDEPHVGQKDRSRPLTSTYTAGVAVPTRRTADFGADVYAAALVPVRRQSEQWQTTMSRSGPSIS